MNRQRVITVLLLALVLTPPANARDHRDADPRREGSWQEGGHHRQPDTRRLGRVVEVRPIWPRQQCRPVSRQGGLNRDGARITGAVAGGALGHLVGREHDNALLGTVAGVLIGVAGAEVVISSQPRNGAERCARGPGVKYHHSPIAYQVRYRYQGRVYTTRTRTRPGRYIELNSGHHRRG